MSVAARLFLENELEDTKPLFFFTDNRAAIKAATGAKTPWWCVVEAKTLHEEILAISIRTRRVVCFWVPSTKWRTDWQGGEQRESTPTRRRALWTFLTSQGGPSGGYRTWAKRLHKTGSLVRPRGGATGEHEGKKQENDWRHLPGGWQERRSTVKGGRRCPYLTTKQRHSQWSFE